MEPREPRDAARTASAAGSGPVAGLVDIGANLTSPAFRDDLPAVMARAAEAGVATMVVTGGDLETSQQGAALAERHGALYATAGVHPHHAGEVLAAGTAWMDELRALARRPRVVALGECGLDFFRNFSGRDQQLACFEAQLTLAGELAMPVFLHERDAHRELLAMIKNHRRYLPRAVVHCFTGMRAELDAYLALDLHIGITGWICDERRGRHLPELVAAVPADRLMIETDAPYLLPRTLPNPPRSRRNEPAFLGYVLRAVAAARGESPEETARATTATARRFFGLPPPGS
jgi:TatD DNase family protein